VINEKFFNRLSYDRKTERYKTAISLARIILLNYHPDIKGGRNNILAIMFDMNLLWENYVYYILKRAIGSDYSIKPQRKKYFWKPENGNVVNLQPDIVIERKTDGNSIVLDTKWKYQSDVSVQDLRQMYAYGKYFNSDQSYLVYPDKVNDKNIDIKSGKFLGDKDVDDNDAATCGLLFIDILQEGKRLNRELGEKIFKKLIP